MEMAEEEKAKKNAPVLSDSTVVTLAIFTGLGKDPRKRGRFYSDRSPFGFPELPIRFPEFYPETSANPAGRAHWPPKPRTVGVSDIASDDSPHVHRQTRRCRT